MTEEDKQFINESLQCVLHALDAASSWTSWESMKLGEIKSKIEVAIMHLEDIEKG